MKKLRIRLYIFLLKLWWNSWWGKAIIHASFNRYKNSIIFRERSKYFSKKYAARLFRWSDFKKFRRIVLKDKKLMFTIVFKPVKMYKKFQRDNYRL